MASEGPIPASRDAADHPAGRSGPPVALAYDDLHADTAGLGPSIWSVGLPEELAKAIPVLAVAVIYWLRGRHELTPKDYLFLARLAA